VKKDIAAGTIITNPVTINSNEAAPTTTSVDVKVENNPLILKKSIIGSTEGQVVQVQSNDIITYAIDFDNKNNDFPVTEITVVDTLSMYVTFISAKDQDGKDIGKFEDKEHIWTWSIDSLEPQEEIHIELEVSVNPDLPLGTTITNIVAVDGNEAPPSSASVDAVVSYKPPNITKIAMDSSGSEIKWIEPGKSFTYKICFDISNNDFEVTGVSLRDTLPSEVTFLSANINNKNFIGYYDLKSRTYIGSLKSLEPNDEEVCLELEVNVNKDTPLDTIISNSVIIDSNETLPAIADVIIVTGEPFLEVENLSITPNELRRNGTSPLIKAVVPLPQGFNKSDINPDDQPKLYYQDRNTGEFKLIGSSLGGSYPTGTENSPTITVYFSRPELMNAAQYYGRVTLRIEGKLNTGQSYYGDAMIHITKFAGD
jgi:fimbrial isopeptide formation D2 family protein